MSQELRANFKVVKNAINHKEVPKRILHTGAGMPAVGLGTFGSDRFTNEEIADAVLGAISVGYRHIDCASVYMNEPEIGKSLGIAIQGGVPREELWITSKVWNDMHGQGDVLLSCAQTLKDLRLDYLDLYLLHWPFPNYHAPGCDGDSRNPDSKPFSKEEFMATWRQMERLLEMGLVKHIGTSNMTIPKFKEVWDDMIIKPAVNEMELHPHFQQQELYDYCVSKNIQPVGFCPIGSPTRPDRDKTENDTVDIEDPAVLKAAKRLNVHPAVVCVKWGVQRGQIPIPFSVKENEYRSNLEASIKDPLTDEEMEELSKIDKNCRLIKGQVFLWEGADSWEDLWDLDGEITE
ncbi:aldo/keto reductase [Vallitalea okinawensis]|uniref:aldo/keto reductase n=1 Tax=Vallitalea okinawensis TaxID=2078660 RepID=UPI001A9A5CFC|nr:aldo/keto reductase [Vallitalea okinawensis]